jgi:hypothetical protein
VRWDQQIERARYEVDLARRQYDAVGPANRLVAGALERRWEMALKALEEVRPDDQVMSFRPATMVYQRDAVLPSQEEIWHGPFHVW